MLSVNKVTIIGNLGADAETHATTSGSKIVNLRVATSEKVGDEERTQWHRVKVLGKGAENAARFKKGESVYLEGKIEYTKWEKDGVTHYGTDIVTFQVLGVGGGKKADGDIPF